MKLFIFNQKVMSIIALFIVIVGCAVAYGVYSQLKETDDHLKNCIAAKRLYAHFKSFEMDYLSLPGPEAVEMDPELAGFSFNSSNGYLGQLLVAMNANSEDDFFIKGSSVCPGEHPDNIVAPNNEALKAGENGWAYFTNRDLTGDGRLPLLVPGWNPKSKEWDEPIWKHGVPVLHVDGSVTLYRADSNSKTELNDFSEAELPFNKTDPNLLQPLAK